jgi:prepilin-type N-terminal cleavage/methylation domain-containing protein
MIRRAFTLMEVLIAMGISAVVVLLAWQFFGDTHTQFLRLNQQQLRSDNNQVQVVFLEKQLRQAEEFQSIRPGVWIWTNPQGQFDTLSWADSSVYFNQRLLWGSADTIHFEWFGVPPNSNGVQQLESGDGPDLQTPRLVRFRIVYQQGQRELLGAAGW